MNGRSATTFAAICWLGAAVCWFGAAAQEQQPPGQQRPGQQQPGQEQPKEAAVLQGLDKVTARISTFEAPIDKPVRFGTLEITARTCHKRPPEETPESAAFLEIVEIKPGEDPVPLFKGWMFASSPALSAMEHPVYDVWVIDCKNAPSSSSDSSG